MLTNLVNGKKYVGQTTVSLKKRLIQHRCRTTTSLISKAINKYGIENFKVEVIHETDCRMMLDYMEAHFIALYKTTKENGYNLTYGGESTWAHRVASPMLGRKHSEETKSKMSAASKGKPKSPEHAKKCAKANIGKKWSEAHKQKWSKVRTGKTKAGNKIVDTESGIIYKSVSEAAKMLGIGRRTLIRWLFNYNKVKTTNRYKYLK